ncbi:hypothetical protein M427DRAFT_413009 [Gonapodya prolifera JEL478]|uniref:E3 ubiquitin-protein ligase listerin n=1 Tax=Gonapodya prolifera (strain JEL478) TaxID=1344416 RepID=A0A139A5F5_GONPJ|nr:hypothetical protein M427DRAFT_413009 [Gonapodya prolifera JEL478]|eukprot:KXS12047.1 hypothetical protein M427DRAFT_413009 [Gonapodya prolifera JEL478]
MGKNNPKAPRPKSSVTPASSSRAADALASQSTPSTFGFTSSQPTLIGFSNNSPELAIESLADADVKVVLRRLAKRDPTTRAKAGDEFASHIRGAEPDEVATLLPAWVGLYPRLSGDVDRRVREVVGVAHLEIVRKLGKRLAPHLKEMAGAWVAATFDPAREVARVAQEALQTAFPSKRAEFLTFVQIDLLNHIRRTLLEETPESLSDPRFTSKEDMDARYSRAVAAALQTLSLLFDMLSPTEREKHLSAYDDLVNESKLWATVHHKDVIVRRAAYPFVATLCRKWPDALSGRIALIAAQVPYRALSDREPSAHGDMWEAVLLLTKTLPAVWTHTPKPVIPKLISFFRTLAPLSPKISYPSLLPLFSILPTDLVFSNTDEILQGAWDGARAANDKDAAIAGAEAVAECLAWVAGRLSHASDTAPGSLEHLVISRMGAMILAAAAQGTQAGLGRVLPEEAAACVEKALFAVVGQVDVPVVQVLLHKIHATLCSHLAISSPYVANTFGDPPADLTYSAVCVNVGELIGVLARVSRKMKSTDNKSAEEWAYVTVDIVARVAEGLVEAGLHQEPLAALLLRLCRNPDINQHFTLVRAKESLCTLAVRTLPTIIPAASRQSMQDITFAILEGWNATRGPKRPDADELTAFRTLIDNVLQASDIEFEKSVCVLTPVLREALRLRLGPELNSKQLDGFLVRVVSKELGVSHKKSNPNLVTELEDLVAVLLCFGCDIPLLTDSTLTSVYDIITDTMLAFTTMLYTVEHHHEHLVYIDRMFEVISFTNIILNVIRQYHVKVGGTGPTSLFPLSDPIAVKILTVVFDLSQFGAIFSHEDTPIRVRPVREETDIPNTSSISLQDQFESLNVTLQSKALAIWSESTSYSDQQPRLFDALVDSLLARWYINVRDLHHIGSPFQFVSQLTRIQKISVSSREMTGSILGSLMLLEEPWKLAVRSHLASSNIMELAALDDPLVVPGITEIDVPGSFDEIIERDVHGLSHLGRFGAIIVGTLRFAREDGFFGNTTGAVFVNRDETGDIRDFIALKLTELRRIVNDCRLGVMVQIYSLDGVSGNTEVCDHTEPWEFSWGDFTKNLDTVWKDTLDIVLLDSDVELLRSYLDTRAENAESGHRPILSLFKQLLEGTLDVSDKYFKLVARGAADMLAEVFERDTIGPAEREQWQRMLRNRSFASKTPFLVLLMISHAISAPSYDDPQMKNVVGHFVDSLLSMNALSNQGDIRFVVEPFAILNNLHATSKIYGQRQLLALFNHIQRSWLNVGDLNGNEGLWPIQFQLVRWLAHTSPLLESVSETFWNTAVDVTVFWLEVPGVISSSWLLPLRYYIIRLAEALLKRKVAERLPFDPSKFYRSLLSYFMVYCGSSLRDDHPSAVRQATEDLLAAIAKDVPTEILNQTKMFNDLVSLLWSKNSSVQTTATLLLQRHIREGTQMKSLKIEMRQGRQKANMETSEGLLNGEMDEDSDPDKLPGSLLDIAGKTPSINFVMQNDDEHLEDHVSISGYLFSWLLILDHFEGAAFQLKASYINHLRHQSELVPTFFEALFRLLGVLATRSSGELDVSKWHIHTIDLLEVDLGTSLSFSLFAAHVYWRCLKSLPSLVRMWWLNLRNRQTSQAIELYTETYFSPSLVNMEFEQLSEFDVTQFAKLKVRALKTSSEVQATYEVEDNATLGVAIKFSSSFPLKQCEIDGTGGARVGVPEAKWRAWVLGLSSVMLVQNGDIMDALALWHKNVTLHYDGVEDCTICYSIVGVIDRSLPSRRCRTCRNKFHAACLHKWFKSSGQASCPLCRSTF